MATIGTDGLKPIESTSGFGLFSPSSTSSLSGNKLLYTYADIDNLNKPYGNLFKSFNFPITGPENTNFEQTYNNTNNITALATLNRKKIIVVEIPKGEYGELIDGKTFQLTIPVMLNGVASATTLYGTYFGFSGTSTTYLPNLNTKLSEQNICASQFGLMPSTGNNFNSNVTFLYSNDIQKPKNITGSFELYKSAITLSNNTIGTELQLTGMTLSSGDIIKVTVTSTESPAKDISGIRVIIKNQIIYNGANSNFLTIQAGISSLNPSIWDISTSIPVKNIEIKIDIQNSSNLSWNTYELNNRFPPNGNTTKGKMYARYVGNDRDKPVGILYNDKGIAVITDPILVSGFRFSAGTSSGFNEIASGSPYNLDTNFAKIYFTSSTLSQSTFKSITSEFVQNITCIAGLNEFTGTTNSTYVGAYDDNATEKPFFITTIGLYNSNRELIGIGKLSEPVKKTQSNIIPFNIKLII